MTKLDQFIPSLRTSLLVGAAAGLAGLVMSEGISINYDALSSLEEPIAIEVGDTTVHLRGLLDVPFTATTKNGEDWDTGGSEFIGNFEVSAETQLPNRWNAGVVYFGQYETPDIFDTIAARPEEGDHYEDRAAVFVSGAWGTVAAGNVSGLVREETRRTRGIGNGRLAFDGLRGSLSESGVAYVGRFGPTRLSAVVDEDGDFEVGATFQRPLGKRDYRFTGRYAEGTAEVASALDVAETRGVEALAEITYGSSQFDVAVGAEKLDATSFDADRWYTSVGARRKIGTLAVSAEAHYGEVDGQSETSASVGAAFDIARGLSLNLGINYEDAQIDLNGLRLERTGETEAVLSLRYSF